MARKNRGLTQLELARRAGVSREMLVRIEKADTRVGIAGYLRIATALGYEISLTPSRIPTLDELSEAFKDE